MNKIRQRLKERRKALGLKQADMMLRIGMSRQQYQHLESKGNPSLDTLELVAKGLKMKVMLIPQEKLREVQDFLANEKKIGGGITMDAKGSAINTSSGVNPWGDLLDDADD